ncbi:MAG TPA: hypothetical protein VF772_22190, partial [Terriglobales bacterium]
YYGRGPGGSGNASAERSLHALKSQQDATWTCITRLELVDLALKICQFRPRSAAGSLGVAL